MGFSVGLTMEFRRPATRRIIAAALLGGLASVGLGVGPSRAQEAQEAQPDSPLKSVLKITGFATDVKPPPDFVQQSRPAVAPAPMPAFTKSPEPPGKPKSPKELDAMSTDLEAISKRDDKLRAAFPPAAKAMAAAAAAKEAKANKHKEARKSPIPAF